MKPRATSACGLVAAALMLAGCQTASIDELGNELTANAAVAGPGEHISLGNRQFEAGNYGLAERYFRLAAETTPRDPQAWLGLAAAYDQLGRFDLSDRAYGELIRLEGRKASILNNQGYSYLLRGDVKKARKLIGEARTQAPDNPIIEGNWQLVASTN